jgi:stage V sporulation protein B
MHVMSYTKRAFKGFLIVFVISIMAAFLGYLIRIVLARNLTVAEYGLFFSVFTLVNFFAIFNGLGMGEAMTKYIPEFQVKKSDEKIANAIFYLSVMMLASFMIVGLLLLSFSNVLTKYYFKTYLAGHLLLLFFLIMVFSNLRGVLRNIYQGFQKMTGYALIYLLENAFTLLILLLLFAFKKDIFTAAYAHIAGYVLVLAIFIFLLFKFFPFKYKLYFDKRLFKKLISFGLPVVIIILGGMLIVYVDTLILTYFRSLSEVGIYNVVVPTVMIIQFFASAIATVSFPMISELWARRKKKFLEQGVKMLLKYSFVILIPAVLIVLFFSRLILSLMFGEQYVPGTLTMQVLAVAIIFLSLHSIISPLFAGTGRPKIAMRIIIQGAVLNVLINFIAIPRYGMLGAAVTSLLTYAYIFIVSVVKLKQFIKVELPLMNWVKTLISGGLMIGLIWMLKEVLVLNVYLETAITIIVGGLFYLFLIWAGKLVSVEEIKESIKIL